MEHSPLDDTIISGAVDDSVMIWDPRYSGAPIATIPLITGTPLVAFDPQGICPIIFWPFLIFLLSLNIVGVLFGIALTHNQSMRLYDIRAYERGPFSTWEIPNTQFSNPSSWSRLIFSNDGNNILISGITL